VKRLARALAVALALVAAGPAEAKGKPLQPGEKVDLNGAPIAELMRLPGVGRKRAEAIAALRAKRPFRRADDVAQVKGISPGWVAKHRALLDVSPPGTIGGAVRPAANP
jgi:competence protein ComEA